MAVRQDRNARTTESDDLDRPVIIFDDGTERPTRPGWHLALAIVVLAVAVVGAAFWWAARGGDVVVTQPAAQAPVPAPDGAPAALTVTVAAPDAVVAGQAARFVVSYADGSGIFGGSVEDWGEVGVGSLKQRACSAAAPPAGPVRASFVATHKWRTAGSYQVSFSVTTYTCSNGQATQETQKAPLTVVVAAAP